MQDKIFEEARGAIAELLEKAVSLKPGDIVVVGCSTSTVIGAEMGKASSAESAKAIMDAFLPAIREKGLYMAVQCCEHLNRALVVERECLNRYNMTEVCVLPQPHAGGAFAVEAVKRFDNYAMVENINALASAGIDVGGTFIGMHLHPVAVPIHASHTSIGEAHVTMARTRPKFIGGERAVYPS